MDGQTVTNQMERAASPNDSAAGRAPCAPGLSADLGGLLSQCVAAVERIGPSCGGQVSRLEELRERLAGGRFHLAVLGQFKRGKSTLLNALLGEPVLPTSVIPVTAIPTFIRPGQARVARVHFLGQRDPQEIHAPSVKEFSEGLASFVAESANPMNRLGVAQVEVFHPAALLANGVVLIDTPGIGSTFRHNTVATLNFLPQCDAALFLVSADPPITEVEVDFLKQVRSKVARLFLVLNKSDYLDADERLTALEFLRKVLAEHADIPPETTIFCVSARLGLLARQEGDDLLWDRSGLAHLEDHLLSFLVEEKSAALRQAVAVKADAILSECLMKVELTIRSLHMPLADLEGRMSRLGETVGDAQRQRTQEADLLAGDRRRAVEYLEEQAEALRQKARLHFGQIAREAVDEDSGNAAVEQALAEAIPPFFEREMGQMSADLDRHIRTVLHSHHQRADELSERIYRDAADLFQIPYRPNRREFSVQVDGEPYWITHDWPTTMIPSPAGLIERIMPQSLRRRRRLRQMARRVDSLVIQNVERIRWPALQQVEKVFREFALAQDEYIAAAVTATQGAVVAAVAMRREKGQTVEEESARLESVARDLAGIRKQLRGSEECSAVPIRSGRVGQQPRRPDGRGDNPDLTSGQGDTDGTEN